MPLLSICIPTNGVLEWVLPVINSIYAQNVDENDFEVIISNNGNNLKFEEYLDEFRLHQNFKYYVSNAVLFDNCFECYLHSSGEFIKFINHRTILLDGALQYLVDFVRNNRTNRPVVYFANGVLKQKETVNYKKSFDEFVHDLGIYNSWGTGIGFWKEELEEIRNKGVNSLFPDMTILFNRRHAEKYIVDNSILLQEIRDTHLKKGDYDLYFAFGVEFPALICELYRDDDISIETFRYIRHQNLRFLAGLFIDYNILKKQHSYNITHYRDMFGVYYRITEFYVTVIITMLERIIKYPVRILYKSTKKILLAYNPKSGGSEKQ